MLTANAIKPPASIACTLAAIIGVLLAGAFLGGGVVAVLRPHAGHQNDTPEIANDKEIAR